MTAALGLLISGCQNNTPARTKVQTEAEFRRDAINIVQCGSTHPWSGSDRLQDIAQALTRIEATQAKGAAYVNGVGQQASGLKAKSAAS